MINMSEYKKKVVRGQVATCLRMLNGEQRVIIKGV